MAKDYSGKMIRVLLPIPRMSIKILEDIAKAVGNHLPSMGFNGEWTDIPGQYAYTMHPGRGKELEEYASKISGVEGVISASVVDIPILRDI